MVTVPISSLLPVLLDGKVEAAALVPLVFVAHLVELSTKSPFVTDFGCEQTVVEGTTSCSPRGRSR